jgi:hypothetical protein
MRALAAAASSTVLPCVGVPEGAAAIGWKAKDSGRHALIANLRSSATGIELGARSEFLVLNTDSFAAASADTSWASTAGVSVAQIELEPYAVAFVHW